jgi:hypothetical protein
MKKLDMFFITIMVILTIYIIINNINKKDIIYVFIIAILGLYLLCKNNSNEGFNTNPKTLSDIDAIKNLAAVAKDLQTEKGITIPGSLTITSNKNANGNPTTSLKTDRLLLGNKWILTGGGKDVENTDDMWLRLLGPDGTYNAGGINDGGLAMGNLWVRSRSYLNGDTTINGNVTAGNNISVTNNSNEGGRIRILNSKKTGANQTNDWSIWNMTSQYGNKLAFWRYNGDGSSPGSAMDILDNGEVNIPGNLTVQGIQIRDFIPVTISLSSGAISDQLSRERFSSLVQDSVAHSQKSVAIVTFGDGSQVNLVNSLGNRLATFGFDKTYSVRITHDYRWYHIISMTVPPGRMVKVFGWTKLLKKFTAGRYNETLPLDSNARAHVIWIGDAENDNHIPDSYKPNANTF